MTDEQKRIEAMYHLECCMDFETENSYRPKIEGWCDAHITAAHYLVQSMFGGFKPDNYDDVMAHVARLDAIDEANCAAHIAAIAAQKQCAAPTATAS